MAEGTTQCQRSVLGGHPS